MKDNSKMITKAEDLFLIGENWYCKSFSNDSGNEVRIGKAKNGESAIKRYFKEGYTQIFCRGMFTPEIEENSFHLLILDEEGIIHEIKSESTEYAETRAYGALVLAIMEAINWSIESNKTQIVIYHNSHILNKIVVTNYGSFPSKVSEAYWRFFRDNYSKFSLIIFEKEILQHSRFFPFLKVYIEQGNFRETANLENESQEENLHKRIAK